MHIEINGDTETLIKSGVLSGEFSSAEEAVAAMARVWASRKETMSAPMPVFPVSTDITALAAKQGVRPFDPTSAPPDFWPADDSVDDFIAFLRDVRRDAARSGDLPE
jgi:hypothetical protein